MSRRLPRRVRLVEVEGVEVVVDELGLRALHDAEAEAEEDVLDLAPGGGEQVDAAGLDGGRAGKRDVDHVGGEPGVELGGLELGRARLDRRLERLARLVGGAADGAALLGRELGDAAQQVRQLGLAAQEAHPHVLELRRVRRVGDRRLAGGAQLADPLVHGAAILRLHSYRATVAAIAAFRDSARTGIVATSSHAATTSSGRPSRSAPTTSVTSPSGRAAARRRGPPARSCGPAAPRPSRTRATGTSNSAPIDARTAFGPYGSAVPGPSATRSGAEGQRAPQRGADVAGVVDAPQRQAQRAGRLGAQRCP